MKDFRGYHLTPLETHSNWPQILAAFSVSYLCISSGNIIGYTSSAIPSIRLSERQNQNNYSNNESFLVDMSLPLENELYPFSEDNSSLSLDWNGNNFSDYENITNEFESMTDAQASWISGMAPLGAFVGSLMTTVPIEYLGPKGTILYLGAPMFIVSWLITAFAPSINIIYLGRFLGGLATGLSVSTSPVYVVDSSSVNLRGPLGTISQCFITVGILISFIMGGILNWRNSAICGAVIVFPSFILLAYTPESPIWLLSKNRLREAELAYCRLRGNSSSPKEFQEMKNRAPKDLCEKPCSLSHTRNSLVNRFTWPAVKSIFVALGLMCFQQFTGVSTINFYAVSIFTSVTGPDTFLNEHVSSIIVATVQCLATFTSFFLIEKLGRKILLILSILFIGLATTVMGAFFYVLEKGEASSELKWLPLLSLITFVLAFSIGFGPVCFIICAEILSPDIRTTVNPIAVGVNWLCVFLVTKTYPDLVNCFDTFGVFWLYGMLAFIGLVFTVFCVPETKGKSEEDIQRYFGKRILPERRWGYDDDFYEDSD